MTKRIDLIGQKFGLWTVIRYSGMNELKQSTWWCECDCGTKRAVVAQTLRNGLTKSCGCQKSKAIAAARTKHGHCANGVESEMYVLWKGMLNRCKRNPYYKGRVFVCERWLAFENFLIDMGNRRMSETKKDLLTIERRNNDGNYEPANCYWATWSQQNHNRRPCKERGPHSVKINHKIN